jgi:hypothetical protein
MKKTLIGLVAAVLLLVSIFGAASKGPKPRRTTAGDSRPDRILWV